ncbi:hypothetical protein THAOC_22346, partial [Thalassiosira oceanica]
GPTVASQGPRRPASLLYPLQSNFVGGALRAPGRQPRRCRWHPPGRQPRGPPEPEIVPVGRRVRLHAPSRTEAPAHGKGPAVVAFEPWYQRRGVRADWTSVGVIGHNDILANFLANCNYIQEVIFRRLLYATGTDNTAAHSWATKGAVSSTGPSSYLLRLKSMHQRAHRYQLRTFYIPGPINKMADNCSRCSLSTSRPWQIQDLSPAMHEALNLALLCKRTPPEALDVVLKPVDESDAGSPQQGWSSLYQPQAMAASQRLYEQFALCPKSWTYRRPTPNDRPPSGPVDEGRGSDAVIRLQMSLGVDDELSYIGSQRDRVGMERSINNPREKVHGTSTSRREGTANVVDRLNLNYASDNGFVALAVGIA